MRNKKKLVLVSILAMFLVLVSSFTISASELTPTTTLDTAGTGNYFIELPDTTTGETYNVTLGVISQYDDGDYVYASDEVYYVLVTNSDGSINADLSSYYKFTATWNSVHELQERVVTVPNVPEGSTVTVQNVIVVKADYYSDGSPYWSNYNITYMATTIENPNSDDVVLVDYDADLIQLVVGDTVSQTTTIVGLEENSVARETTDDFFDVHYELFGAYFEDEYEDEDFLTYLLSTYNVVSLDEINSTHIVGPIISQNIAERTDDGSTTGYLAASDYSNGVPSYIGEFTSDGTEIGVKLNYIFDVDQNSTFSAPYLYSDTSNLLINQVGETSNLLDYYIITEDEITSNVLSANNSGQTYTYQNDDFIDFTALEAALINASYDILGDGNAEGSYEFIRYVFDTDGTVDGSIIYVYEGEDLVATITATNGVTYGEGEDERGFSDFVTVSTLYGTGIQLTINMEESWTIKNAENLEEVNMIMPDDYDYYDNPYLAATTINFDCEYINPTDYYIDVDGDGEKEWVTHSVMPFTLINGAEFTASLGEDGEYGEVGNKIIWNMPYVVTDSVTGNNRLTVLNTSHNIAGHIIAPQAEFWNYDSNGEWLGGNLNGTAIVKSFYSGIMEMHMWAYTGLAEEAVIVGIDALKTVNGETPTSEYTFVLDVLYEYKDEDEDIVYDSEGIMNTSFPIYANSSTDEGKEGVVDFSSIAFNEAGTYSFIVYEDTSMDTATDNVTYDKTVYQIVIVVEVSDGSDADTTIYEVTNVSKYKIVDSDGNTLANRESEEEVLDAYEFTFDNITTTEGTVNLTFIKKCETGHVLSGAKFYITEMTSATDESRPSSGYFESVTSDANGNVYITELAKNTYYKLWEYEAPYGHAVAEGYWIIYIDEYGFVESITAMDGAQEIESDMVIYNEHIDSTYLDLIITKKNQMNTTLSGVEFTLESVILDPYGIPQTVANGYYDDTIVTDENGTFEIAHLEADNVYMLTETSTPVAHIEHTGYWLITVTGDIYNPSADLTYTIIEYDENHNEVSQSSNDVIMNEKIEYILPVTGGVGKGIFYTIGITLMCTAIAFSKSRSVKYKKNF